MNLHLHLDLHQNTNDIFINSRKCRTDAGKESELQIRLYSSEFKFMILK